MTHGLQNWLIARCGTFSSCIMAHIEPDLILDWIMYFIYKWWAYNWHVLIFNFAWEIYTLFILMFKLLTSALVAASTLLQACSLFNSHISLSNKD